MNSIEVISDKNSFDILTEYKYKNYSVLRKD